MNRDISDGKIVAGLSEKAIGSVENLIKKRKRYGELSIVKMRYKQETIIAMNASFLPIQIG